MFDANLFKQDFPLFMSSVNSELIYLDNAATTQTPCAVIDAIQTFYQNQKGNPNRSSHRLSQAASTMVDHTRRLAADFVGAEPENIVFTYGATDGLNGLATSLTTSFTHNDEIVISEAEHHANLIPWQQAAQRTGCRLTAIPLTDQGIELAELPVVVNERTRIISLSIGLNSFGQSADMLVLNALLKAIKKDYPKIIIIFDAAQYAAHKAIEAKRWLCDFLVCSAHKFYGPSGVGLLYGTQAALNDLSPWRWGGDMADSVSVDQSHYVASPQKFETGTLPLAAIAGLNACFVWWSKIQRTELEAHEQLLNKLMHQQLGALVADQNELHLLTTSDNNLGLVVLAASDDAGFSVFDLALWLDEHNIAVRAGKLCAELALNARGISSVLRLSLAGYITSVDIEKTIYSIRTFLNEMNTSSLTALTDRLDSLDWSDFIQDQPWQSRYKKLIRWADVIQPKPELCLDAYRVSGCQTDVWLKCDQVRGKYFFYLHSPSRLLRGFAAILLYHFQGKTAEQIVQTPIRDILKPLGFEKHLSVSRNNGFYALLNAMVDEAQSLK